MTHYGAKPSEWYLFHDALGLTADLLPVVSDPTATISPLSTMKALGKTPSAFNGAGLAVGVHNWTQRTTTSKEVDRWSTNPRLGICLQTRHVRALDFDINSISDVLEIEALLRGYFGPELAIRRRSNSSKILILFELEGDYTKRSFKAAHGIVEFLATGQQCIVSGTHTSGVRYEWNPELTTIPTISPEDFETLWQQLITHWAVEPEATQAVSVKKEKLHGAIHSDTTARHLESHGFIKSVERDGRIHISCPFASEHTGESAISATTYFPANTGGYSLGHFDCKHAHCTGRTDEEFRDAIGLPSDLEFEDLSRAVPSATLSPKSQSTETQAPPTKLKYAFTAAADLKPSASSAYLIKNVIPRAEVVMLYGASKSGKSFMALDMACAIGRGIEWRGNRVKQGKVAIVVAEGSGGTYNRIQAYCEYHGIERADVEVFFLKAAPNMTENSQVKELILALQLFNPDLVILDTWAQVTSGANENSGEDMGKALTNAKRIHQFTGATVLIIHHSGKDEAKGARGWSGMVAAADAILEIRRSGDDRVLMVEKQKEGAEGLEFGFKLIVVKLGLDSDGDEETSCVVHEAAVSVRGIGMGKFEKILYKAILDSSALSGLAPDINTALDEAVSQIPYDEVVDGKDRRKEAIKRAYRQMLAKNVILEDDGRVKIKGVESTE